MPSTEWKFIEQGISSALIKVECLGTLDRLKLIEHLDEKKIASRREAVFRFKGLTLIKLSHPVLVRAAQPFPTVLGTLVALHLATALMWREYTRADILMATHDSALGTAAKASGLRVIRV